MLASEKNKIGRDKPETILKESMEIQKQVLDIKKEIGNKQDGELQPLSLKLASVFESAGPVHQRAEKALRIMAELKEDNTALVRNFTTATRHQKDKRVKWLKDGAYEEPLAVVFVDWVMNPPAADNAMLETVEKFQATEPFYFSPEAEPATKFITSTRDALEKSVDHHMKTAVKELDKTAEAKGYQRKMAVKDDFKFALPDGEVTVKKDSPSFGWLPRGRQRWQSATSNQTEGLE